MHFQTHHIPTRHPAISSHYRFGRYPDLDIAGGKLLHWLSQ